MTRGIFSQVRERAGALALAVLVTLPAVACNDERASVFSPIGPPSYDFSVSPSGAGLPAGSVSLPAGGGATLVVSNLAALSEGNYAFWAVRQNAAGLDSVTAAFGTVVEFFLRPDTNAQGEIITDPVTGNPILVEDSTVVSGIRTNAYTGTNDPDVFEVRLLLDSTANGSTMASNNAVVISLEPAGSTGMSQAGFLFRRIGIGGAGGLTFGTFSGADPARTISPNDHVYSLAGAGRGGFRGPELAVGLQNLPLPPVGFFYRGYLVDSAGAGVLVDTLRSPISQIEQENQVSLFDADMNPLLPGVLPTGIREALVRNCATGSGVPQCVSSLNLSSPGPFTPFREFRVMLEPKVVGSSTMGLGIALDGPVPEIVQTSGS